MAKEEDRHTGTRENVWFPWDEHERMLEGMRRLGMSNKSEFIRTAVHNFVKFVNSEEVSK